MPLSPIRQDAPRSAPAGWGFQTVAATMPPPRAIMLRTRTGTGAQDVDGTGAQLVDLAAERRCRRRLIVRPRRPPAAAEVLLFTGVRIIRLPVPVAAAGLSL